MMENCSACEKDIKHGNKLVKSDCGHIENCCKDDCYGKDSCHQLDTNSAEVTLNDTNTEDGEQTEEVEDKKLDCSHTKQNTNNCNNDHSYCMEKFEEQRRINLEIMKKMNLLVNNYQFLIKLVGEQTQNLKVIVEGFTRVLKEQDKIKNDLGEVTEQVVDLLQEVFYECDNSQN